MTNDTPLKALGLWNMGDGRFHALLSPEEAKKAIRRALDQGIRVFDTAVSYGNADTFLASVSKERRLDRETIAIWSKVMPVPTLEKRFEGELRNLKSEYVDVLMLHWPTEDRELFRSLRTLEILQERQKTKEIGVSNFPPELLEKVASDFPVSYHERALSPLWTKGWEEEKKLSLKTIAYAPGAFGVFGEKYNAERPGDMRGMLPCWNHREFLPLRDAIQTIARRDKTTPYFVSYAFTRALEPYALAIGSTGNNTEETDEYTLSPEDQKTLEDLSERLSKAIPSDNVFGHNWH